MKNKKNWDALLKGSFIILKTLPIPKHKYEEAPNRKEFHTLIQLSKHRDNEAIKFIDFIRELSNLDIIDCVEYQNDELIEVIQKLDFLNYINYIDEGTKNYLDENSDNYEVVFMIEVVKDFLQENRA